MKRIGTIVLMFVIVMTAVAQDKRARIDEIRRAYAQAKKDVDANDKQGHPPMDVMIRLNDGTEVSEDFIINEVRELRYFFKRSGLQGNGAHCYFLTEQWSANGHTSYREMLFDAATEHLMFSFMKVETHAGYVIESRYYYDDAGHLIEEKHKAGDSETTAEGQSWSSSEGDATMARRYAEVFDKLMKNVDAEAKAYPKTQAANKEKQIKRIRSIYAEAKGKIAKDDKSEIPRNLEIVIHDRPHPAAPARKDVVNGWFEYVDGREGASCYFMSSTCTMGDHHVYSEYLPDPKDGHLLFCFSQQKQNSGQALEWRHYFDDAGRCIETKGVAERNGPGFADKDAAKGYLDVFNTLLQVIR